MKDETTTWYSKRLRVQIVETDLTTTGPIVVQPGETLWQAVQRRKQETP